MKKLLTGILFFTSLSCFAEISCNNLKEYSDFDGNVTSPNTYIYMGISEDYTVYQSGSSYDKGFLANEETVISYTVDRGACFLWECIQDKRIKGYEVAISTFVENGELRVEEFYLDSKKVSEKELAEKVLNSQNSSEVSLYSGCEGSL